MKSRPAPRIGRPILCNSGRSALHDGIGAVDLIVDADARRHGVPVIEVSSAAENNLWQPSRRNGSDGNEAFE